jgi:hypothetical protein
MTKAHKRAEKKRLKHFGNHKPFPRGVSLLHPQSPLAQRELRLGARK